MPRRARKGVCREGNPYRMPCRVRKEVLIEHCRVRAPAGARIRKKENHK